MRSFSHTLKKELLSLPFLCWSFFLAVLYIFFTLYALNYRYISTILFTTPYSPLQKINIIQYFFIPGLWTTFHDTALFFLITNALLTGANVMLMIASVRKLRHQGKIGFTIGGVAVVSITTIGCGGCGISLLALAGLSTSLSFLPFKGLELQIISATLLSYSLYYLLQKLHKKYYCRIASVENKKD